MYELCEQSRGRSELIPSLIERMMAIESMHKQGNYIYEVDFTLGYNFNSFFSFLGKQSLQMITHIEAVQAELSSSLAQNKAMMKNVREILGSNVTLIKSNIESLKNRVDRLTPIKK